MAHGVNFFGSNKTANGGDRFHDLPVFINGHNVVSCWKLTADELQEVNESQCVFLAVRSGVTVFPSYVGSQETVRRVIADDLGVGVPPWRRAPFAMPIPRTPIRFTIAPEAVKLATTVDGFIECEVDGVDHTMIYVRTKREDAPEQETVDAFAELERNRHIIAQLSALVEGAALHLIDGKPLEDGELAGYMVELARATDRAVIEVKPPHFDISEAGVMTALDTWERNNESTFCRVLLVGGHNVTEEEVAGWTDDQCKEADIWACSTHISASDNDDMVVPNWPSFIAKADRNADRHMITGEPL